MMNYNNLNSTIEEIVLNKNKIKEMAQKALTVSTSDVEDKIYKEIKKVIEEKKDV